MSDPLDRIRDLIQQDAGNRGLRTDPEDNLVTACAGDLRAACVDLARTESAILAVVTGFFIPHALPPSGETDGPLGALFLARALTPLGVRVIIASDSFCLRALDAGLAASGLRKSVPLVTLPSFDESSGLSGTDYWQEFTARAGRLTHLLALERVGPSHTRLSLEQQFGVTPEIVERFVRQVPAEDHDRCHTMRGNDITPSMSPAHRLFEAAPAMGIRTIGIGDGGNEIGMGKIPWDVIARNIPGGARVACRVPTDHLIVAGVSNWGAYALGAGVRLLRGGEPDERLYDSEHEAELLELMVERGPLVDGVTGSPTATVDGLPWDQYAAPLEALRGLCGA